MDQNAVFSFKFLKKKTSTPLLKTNQQQDDDSNKDKSILEFVRSSKGGSLKNSCEDGSKDLVIPCRQNINTLQVKIQESGKSILEKQAAEEIYRDLANVKKEEPALEPSFAIPLTSTEEKNPQISVNLESTLDDYDNVPVSDFGAAMLRGMGWKKGDAIGGTNKGLTVPIEFIPRSHGLGLGAKLHSSDNEKIHRLKPGDKKSSSERSGPVIEKDGKVRHYRGLDEKQSTPKFADGTFSKGGFIVIEHGPFKDLSGKIISNDEMNDTITARLAINDKEIKICRRHVRLVNNDEYKQFAKGDLSKYHKNSKKRKEPYEWNNERSERTLKTSKVDDEEINGVNNGNNCWLAPLLRVRIISKSFRNGKYYHHKVVVEDVITQSTCLCRTNEGRLLEDVPQNVLETVIPKVDPRYILFVQGKHKGSVGEIVQLESSKHQAVVQMMGCKRIVKSHYDDICEYTGRVS